jgi:hypothetical protein
MHLALGRQDTGLHARYDRVFLRKKISFRLDGSDLRPACWSGGPPLPALFLKNGTGRPSTDFHKAIVSRCHGHARQAL